MILLICVKVTLVFFETLEKVVRARIGEKKNRTKTITGPNINDISKNMNNTQKVNWRHFNPGRYDLQIFDRNDADDGGKTMAGRR